MTASKAPPEGYGPVRRTENAHGGDVDKWSSTTGPGRIYRVGKRCLDISLSALGLIFGAPIFLAIIILIRIESPGRPSSDRSGWCWTAFASES